MRRYRGPNHLRQKRPDRAIEVAIALGMPLKIAAKVDAADQDYFEGAIKPLYWRHKSRMVWFCGSSNSEDTTTVNLEFKNKKVNRTAMQPPFGLRLRFDDDEDGAVHVEPSAVAPKSRGTIADRILAALEDGPKTAAELASIIQASPRLRAVLL